jgi:hypothetical protein
MVITEWGKDGEVERGAYSRRVDKIFELLAQGTYIGTLVTT